MVEEQLPWIEEKRAKETAQSTQEIELPIIDIKKPNDGVNHFIESIETETCVDVLLQVQQQEPQYQAVEVSKVEVISQVQQQQQQQQSQWF